MDQCYIHFGIPCKPSGNHLEIKLINIIVDYKLLHTSCIRYRYLLSLARHSYSLSCLPPVSYTHLDVYKRQSISDAVSLQKCN